MSMEDAVLRATVRELRSRHPQATLYQIREAVRLARSFVADGMALDDAVKGGVAGATRLLQAVPVVAVVPGTP